MASATSVISISIVGDASKFNSVIKGLPGTVTKVAGLISGAFLTTRLIGDAFGVVQGGLDKADKLADALERIEGTVSPEFAERMKDVAFSVTDMGLSADEFTTLAADFADIATAAGASKGTIEGFTGPLITLAAALAAQTGKTPDQVIEDIAKAIKGNKKPVEEYGIVVDKALNPDETIMSIFAQLSKKIPDAKSVLDDYAGSQDTLNAKWDNFTIKLGEAVEGPLKDTLDWMNDMADSAPGAFGALDTLADKIHGLSPASFPDLGSLFDLLGGIIDRASKAETFQVQPGGSRSRGPGPGTGATDYQILQAINRERRRRGLDPIMGIPG